MSDEPTGPWLLTLVVLVIGVVALARELLDLRRNGQDDESEDS